jgi:hypothetical protein
LLQQARKADVIVRAADGTEYMITLIDDFDRELAAQRRNEKLMAFLDERARSTEWIPLEEVERRLGLSPQRKNGKKPKRARQKK